MRPPRWMFVVTRSPRGRAIAFGKRHEDGAIPGAVETQRLVHLQVARPHVQACGVNAEQSPWEIDEGWNGSVPAHDNGRPAGAAAGTRIGEEVALSLEPQAERRREHGMANAGDRKLARAARGHDEIGRSNPR